MRNLATGALAFWASYAAAQTTLYIPGFDPQAITADAVGTDGLGHTTWVIGPGVASGSFDEAAIVGSATLVAGSNDAHLVWNDPVDGIFLSEDCGIKGGIAVCTNVASAQGIATTNVETETATGFVVQVAATAAAPVDSNTAAVASTGSIASAGSAATSGPSQTGSAGTSFGAGASQTGSAATSPTGISAAGRMETSSMALSLGAILTYFLL